MPPEGGTTNRRIVASSDFWQNGYSGDVEMPRRSFNQMPDDPIGKFIGGGVGLIFAGVGLTVLVFLWTSSGFGAPPLFFRVFGSFIALAFVLIGGGSFLAAVGGKQIFTPPNDLAAGDEGSSEPAPSAPADPLKLSCPRCGATVSDGAEVSPHGDVKCSYCQSWFNVHAK
jgi:hypothetical protein